MRRILSSRDRVLATFVCDTPDRVPINYIANPGIDRRLKDHFGLQPRDSEGLRQALGVDFRGVNAPYRGPRLFADISDRGVSVDNWGVHRRYVEHESGGYWDYCDFPLQAASEEEIASWPMPNPDDFDYGVVKKACEAYGSYAISTGGPGLGDVLNSSGFIRGVEQTLIDMITDDPAGLLLAKRRTDIQLEITRRTLEAAEGRIDFIWMGEDLGTQIAPMVSPEIYIRNIKTIHQKFADLAKHFGIPVMIHTCGSSSWAYEHFIEMGIKVVDTLQPEAAHMAPAYLKSKFGGRLAFHGCISTAGPVAYGSVQDVERCCKDTLDIMKPGGGYCFAPTHALQDNSPTENVLAMYDVAKSYGVY